VKAPSKYSDTLNKRLSPVDLWIVKRLVAEEPVVLPIIINDYARERGLSEKSARRILERRLKALVEAGIVERLPTYPVTYRLRNLPIEFFAQISGSHQASDQGFDLRNSSRVFPSLVNRLVVSQKISESRQSLEILRKMGLRIITRANSFRQKGLLIAQHKHAIKPGAREHADIAYLYEENIKWWNHSVLVFVNDFEQYLLAPVSTRFTDEKRAKLSYLKSRMALKIAFRRYKDAIMITHGTPHIPLSYPSRT